MATADVTAGVCGFQTKVVATLDEETGQVKLELDTRCDMLHRLAMELPAVDGHEATFLPAPQNPVVLAAGAARLHAACPVPVAIVKAVEIACGLALPRDVAIKLSR